MRDHAPPLPAVLAGLVLLVAVVWAAHAPAEPDPAARDREPDAVGQPDGHLATHRPPDDQPEAEAVAREFALAVTSGDPERLDALTSPDYTEQLIGPQARTQPAEDAQLTVDGVTTRDLQDNRVTLQVLLRDETGERPRVEALTLALARTPDGDWRVVDGAW